VKRYNLANSARGFILVSAAVLGFSALSQGQATKRCDLLVKSTPGVGADTACLDLEAVIKGNPPQPIQTAGNATRISTNGFRLCKSAFQVQTKGEADIAFIYDNSGSMMPKVAAVDSLVPTDTLFYYDSSGCQNPTSAGNLTYQTQEGVRTIPLLASNKGCRNLSGDPYLARGFVIKAAIDYIATSSPTSTVGATGFNNTTAHSQSLLQMNVPGNAVTVKNSIGLDTTGGTLYGPPLRLVNGWLANPAMIKTLKKAIVFISDGAPTDVTGSGSYLNSINPNIPIFSIYLGKIATPDTANLMQMSVTTGGQFYRVNPNNVAQINDVMKKILESILITNIPTSILITNNSFTPPQVSRSIAITRNQVDSSVNVNLDSIIALKQGENLINVKIIMDSATPPKSYDVKVKADGALAGATTKDLICYDPPKLVMLRNNLEDSVYPNGLSNYLVRLTRSNNDLSGVVVGAVSKDSTQKQPWGDAENIALSLNGTVNGVTTYQNPYTVNGSITNPTANNGVLESDANGKLILTWVHPRDTREFAVYELSGKKVPVVNPFIIVERVLDVPKGVIIPVPISNPVVIWGDVTLVRVSKDSVNITKGKCLSGCGGVGKDFADPKKTPSFVFKTAAPFSYTVWVYDNLGNFVNTSEGTVSAVDWNTLQKKGDSVTVAMSILPISKNGQQLGTGVYILRAAINSLPINTKNQAGDDVRVTAGSRIILNRFGYQRP
jgi:hypothetical protein